MNLKKLFLDYCKINRFEKNNNQLLIIEAINEFYQNNFKYNFFVNLFVKKKKTYTRFLFAGRCWCR